MHTTPSGKKYIGITNQKPNFRWGCGSGYKKQLKFYNAILKYGWDNIEHKILFKNLSKEEAEQKEIELIQLYNLNSKNGYNATNGGYGTRGIPCSDAKKTKISIANTGHLFIQEQKNSISNGLKKYYSKNLQSNAKKVICIETKIIYQSIHEAYRMTGIQYKNIHKVCQNAYGRKTAGGYHWQYYENYSKIKKEGENK